MCYAGPVIGAFITSFLWKKTKSVRLFWLNLLFWGGALFGVIDHLWNGELFLISENIGMDFLLGGVITVSILIVWRVMLLVGKKHPALSRLLS